MVSSPLSWTSRHQELSQDSSFLPVEQACQQVQHLAYQPVIRFRHLHAVKVMQGLQEDERHICLLDDLLTMSPSSLIELVKKTFQEHGHVTSLRSGV